MGMLTGILEHDERAARPRQEAASMRRGRGASGVGAALPVRGGQLACSSRMRDSQSFSFGSSFDLKESSFLSRRELSNGTLISD